MRLQELARTIKSANAGASLLTFDIVYEDRETFERLSESGILSPELIARLYSVSAESVEIYQYAPANTTKITIPRGTTFGGVDERDFDGVQQFIMLLNIQIPDEVAQKPTGSGR